MIVEIPFDCWYGDRKVPIDLPDHWDVGVFNIAGADTLSHEDLRDSFESPIASPRISDLASRQKNVVIVAEDISRPASTADVIPMILDELEKGKAPPKDVTFIMATGAYGLQEREDIIKKLGQKVCGKYNVQTHDCHENLTYLGNSSFGTSLHLNRTVLEADLKIGVGGIYPHGSGVEGFGGGAKIVVPGVAGLDTITQNHRIQGFGNQRKEMVELARMISFDFIVNAVIDDNRNIVGLFVGDIVTAHKEGVEFARKVYETPSPPHAVDIAVTGAYPLDVDLGQATKALGVAFRRLKEDGCIVLAASCREGGGYHALYHRGGTLWRGSSRSYRSWLGERKFVIFSQNLTKDELHKRFLKGPLLFNSWNQTRSFLEKTYGSNPKVAVFPAGAIST